MRDTEACLPSPCINGGTCMTTMDGGSQEMFHCACAPQFTGVYCETAASSTNGNTLINVEIYIYTHTMYIYLPCVYIYGTIQLKL